MEKLLNYRFLVFYNLSNVRSGITPVYQNYSEQKNVQSLYGSAQFWFT